jgi:ferredoxin
MSGRKRAAVVVSDERCVHCGACTSVCPSSALSMDAPGWALAFQPSRCIACKRCLGACPLGAISASDSSDSDDYSGSSSG